ncbi:hypothetical protein [Nostoc sp. UHCC 0870]|uniref:hypothetical protein n=1 Tax=Nostoc sp. UHCC 0870 TaxID=2914041 RepID=UPI001EDD6397|nr:hypothetical protein [Nostoc sp. UHCC 0870]UKP01603.1 hypothetical protein L6494_30725 [Nostoc sp. UHCC 0870]
MKGYSIIISKGSKQYSFKSLGTKEQIIANLRLEFSEMEIEASIISPLSPEDCKILEKEIDADWDNY